MNFYVKIFKFKMSRVDCIMFLVGDSKNEGKHRE